MSRLRVFRAHDATAGGGRCEHCREVRAIGPRGRSPLGWHVFVELPVAEAYTPIYVSLGRSLASLAIALAIAFGIVLYLARRIVEPINALHAGAARIEHGNLAERISFRSGDELEDLGEQFNAMAARLQESYADLERKVVERTSELEKANLAKTRFLAVASHDLRQPLHALGMFVGQLKARVEDPGQQRVVDQIEASLAAMNELFDALLDISRIDAQQLSARITDFPVQRLLDRLEATFADMASRKGLSIRIPASPVWIRTDPMLLERIMANIVSNAVRFTRCGGVIVACRRRGGSLRLEVCDSGPGIPSDQLENVFNEFVRLVPAHADEKQGLGLGLAIVDRLSRLLAHRIEAKSVVGRGSCFSVMVPIVVTPATLPKVSPSNDRFADGLPIALIDDDALVLESMGGLLRSWGFRVVEAASVDQAVAALERCGETPGLIVADLGLTNGQRVLLPLRACPSLRWICPRVPHQRGRQRGTAATCSFPPSRASTQAVEPGGFEGGAGTVLEGSSNAGRRMRRRADHWRRDPRTPTATTASVRLVTSRAFRIAVT